MNVAADEQLMGFSLLLQISRRVREANRPEEIGFIAVNESKQLLHYRQSALWIAGKDVLAVSGIPEPDSRAPYIQWLNAAFKEWRRGQGCRAVGPTDLPALLAPSWTDWLPVHGAIAPLVTKKGQTFGLLLLVRDEAWTSQELALLNELAAIYAHGLQALAPSWALHQGAGRIVGQKWRKIAFLALAVGALFYPVQMSVQAPAEVVPKDPFVVRSPFDGVIDRFHVRPNEPVQKGQLLFEFDRTNLRSKMGLAGKAFEVAAEEYRQATQMALADDKIRTEIMPRRGRMEEKAEELSYSQQLFQRLSVRAPLPGIAVFAEQSDWVGKNVAIGEKVLVIADPRRAELLIHLPVADAIEMNIGTPVTFYLATDSLRPLAGKLRYASYKPEVTPAGFVAYRLKADFADKIPPPRIGLTGAVRIYGQKVSLAYFLFRRPWAALRQGLGW